MLFEKESFIAVWLASITISNLTLAYLVKKDYNEQKNSGQVSNFGEYWQKGVGQFSDIIL
ncbi:MAG: hypothetical protein QXU82_00290 [Candidatus Aenigmatarchaeota archaeon]